MAARAVASIAYRTTSFRPPKARARSLSLSTAGKSQVAKSGSGIIAAARFDFSMLYYYEVSLELIQ